MSRSTAWHLGLGLGFDEINKSTPKNLFCDFGLRRRAGAFAIMDQGGGNRTT